MPMIRSLVAGLFGVFAGVVPIGGACGEPDEGVAVTGGAIGVAVRQVGGASRSVILQQAGSVLSVTKAGSGSGKVTSNVGAIDCGTTCNDTYGNDTTVILAATALAGSQFTGWLGPCTGTAACQFTINAPTTVAATFAVNSIGAPRLDIDGVSGSDALTDGLLVMRHLFGSSGAALIAGAVGQGAARSSETQIGDYLTDIHPVLDIDGNGDASAATDAMLVIRYLFGLRGGSLTAGAVGSGATRSGAAMEAQMQVLSSPPVAIHTLSVDKDGTGAGTVTSSPGAIDCGAVCYQNFEGGAMVTLTATPDAGSTFSGWGSPCAGTGSCVLTMDAAKSVTATFVRTTFTLTVNVTGTGTVNSADGKIAACTASSGTCSGIYTPGSTAVMTATTANGSNAWFSDWDSPSCDGPVKTCSEVMNSARTVGATFSAMTNNLIFASSRTYAAGSAIGSVPNADNECNAMATAAGINTAAGTGFMAWLSSSASNAFLRLGVNARGWVRMDGKPVFDSQAKIAAHQIWHPVNRDELGRLVVTDRYVATGTTASGATAASTCQDWTAGAGQFGVFGTVDNGPSGWTAENTFGCAMTMRLYCMGKTKTVALTPVPFAGSAKYAFVSNATVAPNAFAGPGELDAVCAAEKPPGSGTFKAWVAPTGGAAASLLNAATSYMTIEGLLIGTGAEIISASALANGAGMWEHSNLSFPAGFDRVYTGSASPVSIGSNTDNCTDWGSTSGSGIFGYYMISDSRWWNAGAQSCGTPAHVHCIEQ